MARGGSTTAAGSVKTGPVTIHGRIVLVDAEGNEHPGENGSFWARLFSERGENGQLRVFGVPGFRVAVTKGRFEIQVEPGHRLAISGLTLGGHAAVIVEDGPRKVIPDLWADPPLLVDPGFAVDPARLLEVRARWFRPILLHVIDAEAGYPLSSVEIVKCIRSPEAGKKDHLHPGDFEPKAVVVADASSPVRLDPSIKGYWSDRYEAVLWVRSPGYAWAVIEIDFHADEERTLALKPAAELSVTLENHGFLSGPTDRSIVVDRGGWDWEPKLRVRTFPGPSELTESEAERIISELEQRDPTGEDVILGDLRAYVGRLRENPQLEGKMLYERRLDEVDGPIVISGLEAGPVTATVELGPWIEDRRSVLGWVSAELEVGQRQEATLRLTPLPEPEPPAPFAGTLFLPPAWGELDVHLRLGPMDVAGADRGDNVNVPLAWMRPDLEKEGLYHWSAGKVVPGRYEVEVYPLHLLQVLRVPAGGLRDARIELGEPVTVVVRVLEEDSGATASLEAFHWHPEYPPTCSGGTFEVAMFDEEVGGYRFIAPAGRVSLSCWSEGPYQPHLQAHDVHAGSNEITVYLERDR